MSEYIKIGLKLCWIILFSYWFISGLSAKKVKTQETLDKRFIFYWLPLIVAILLLGPGDWFGRSWLRENFVPHNNLVGNIGLSLCIFGLFIACWSRYKLGKNWSLSVQKKENHELIDTGLYRIVRHPIYTGLLLMFIGNALIVGDYRGILAVIIVIVSFWIKLLKEETLLIDHFGQKYIDYRKRTKALIPFVI